MCRKKNNWPITGNDFAAYALTINIPKRPQQKNQETVKNEISWVYVGF